MGPEAAHAIQDAVAVKERAAGITTTDVDDCNVAMESLAYMPTGGMPIARLHRRLRNKVSTLAPATRNNFSTTLKAQRNKVPKTSSLRRSRRIASTGRRGNAIDLVQTVLMRK